ncbi:hypothetical protein GpartN1_g719.t1 [Galdieria partita]|uniref:Sepiapterin reductase n=1 Tax=Galdieria partita TaxID=83374 RepID=A0A9C7PQL4_9RHOD|nr:hypothetical protein GpartN1_g719.t1 [Galdieria partita]
MNKNWVLVTGATRGFGRALAFEWIRSLKLLPDGSKLLVTGRDESKVSQLVEELLEKRPQVLVAGKVLDLNSSLIESDINSLFQQEEGNNYACSYLVNNAGTLGPLGPLEDCDWKTISCYFYENVVTTVYLTNQYIRSFGNSFRHVIHISSLAGIEPLEYCGLYCMGKAAKNMQMRMIACEHKNDIRTLNYAPGPMETDMQTHLRDNLPSGPLKTQMVELWKRGQLVAPSESARKLIGILETGRYENGTHIDFYSDNAC